MEHSKTRLLQPRTLGRMALAAAAIAVIGFTTVAPAKADYDDWRWRRNGHEREWREREWREHHRHRAWGYSYYSYYSYYPSYRYPSYGYGYYSYPSYGYYPYSYGYYR